MPGFQVCNPPQTYIHISILSMQSFLSTVNAMFQQAGCQSVSPSAGNYVEAPGN